MEIVNKFNKDYLSWVHSDGRCPVSHIFVFAKSGMGKTETVEFLAEEWQKVTHGSVVFLCDSKKTVEESFAMYKPEEKYHLERLRLDGLEPESHDVKLWHPWCFGIPSKKNLPDINFYTLSIKDMSAEEFGILAETDFQNESIEIMLRVASDLNNDSGLFDFLHEVQRLVKGKAKRRNIINPDPKNFWLSVGAGTSKSITQISGHLAPFKREYFLRKASCPYSLTEDKLIKILNDNSCFHAFFTRWVAPNNKKIHAFITLSLFKRICDIVLFHAEEIKIPTLVIINDVLSLCPENAMGYHIFLARAFESNLRMMRSTGRGFSSILDSQSWYKTSSSVKDCATVTLFGELAPDDSDRVSKAMNFRREYRENLQNMNGYCKYLIAGQQDKGVFRIFLPRFMHKEEKYVWTEMYKKYFPDKMKNYSELYNYMRKEINFEEDKIKNLVRKQIEEQEAEERRLIEEKKSKGKESEKIKEKIEKIKVKEDKINLNLKKSMYEMFNDQSKPRKERTVRAIGRKFGISHPTVKKYIKDYENSLKEETKEEIEPIIDKGVEEEINDDFENENPENNS